MKRLFLLVLALISSTVLLLAQDESKGNNRQMNMGLGAVTIDGKLYNQIALRPEVAFGKLGVGLDLVLYLDSEGRLRKDEWNHPQDLLDKIMYLRWGHPGDVFYFRYGALDDVTLGYGILVKHYSNVTQYPTFRKVGTRLGLKIPLLGLIWGVDGFVADWKDMARGPGLFGVRASVGWDGFTFGASVVADGNQYLGFKDRDGDGYPDLLDDFPDDPDLYKDSDGDGITDQEDLDVDGDGITDVVDSRIPGYTGPVIQLDPDWERNIKPDPININQDSKSLAAIGFDISHPLMDNGALKLWAAVELAKFLGSHVDPSTGRTINHGWGFAPGIHGDVLRLVHFDLEYRQSSEAFAFSFFDQNYDLQRVTIGSDSLGHPEAITRDMQILNAPPLKGVFGSASANFLNLVEGTASYQDLRSDTSALKSFHASLGLKPGLIPKVKEAFAYFQRMNVADPFDFISEGSLMGYRVTITLGGGATLTWNFIKSFRDLNGDGIIDTSPGSKEVFTTTTFETGFSF